MVENNIHMHYNKLKFAKGGGCPAMQFSLRVICDRSIVETIKQRVAELTNDLCISDEYVLSPYWKDEECVVLELSAKIDNPDYAKIQQHMISISGTDHVSQCYSSGNWECAYFAHPDELHRKPNVAFVVCGIFEA